MQISIAFDDASILRDQHVVVIDLYQPSLHDRDVSFPSGAVFADPILAGYHGRGGVARITLRSVTNREQLTTFFGADLSVEEINRIVAISEAVFSAALPAREPVFKCESCGGRVFRNAPGHDPSYFFHENPASTCTNIQVNNNA